MGNKLEYIKHIIFIFLCAAIASFVGSL